MLISNTATTLRRRELAALSQNSKPIAFQTLLGERHFRNIEFLYKWLENGTTLEEMY